MEPQNSGKKQQILPPEVLLQAYGAGVFPMALESGELGWFSPDPRGIIPIEGFHVPHGLAQVLKKNPFEVRINTDFKGVMRGCADRESTWINEAILESYHRLHQMGHAHSVEVWQDGALAGGLYGVSMGAAFFGESMFSRQANASKVALHALVQRLAQRGYTLLDTQWVTEHLKQFGAHEISRNSYLRRLQAARALPREFID